MTRQRLGLLIVASLFIVFAWIGVAVAREGLVVRSLDRNGLPMMYVAPTHLEKLPGVLIAHGFAGSKQLMLGYAYTLAHRGYATILWDFDGHGANAAPLGQPLQQNFDIAYAALLEQPEVDPDRLAVLGHSMGSGVVMAAGIEQPDRFAATVAVSPIEADVTIEAPRNLQLQAGSWEGRFVENAQRLLQTAGGAEKNLAAGRGRSLVVVPKAEHITILFQPASHQAALEWLNTTFGLQPTSHYVDRRMLWYGLHLLGWLMLLRAIAPTLTAWTTDRTRKVNISLLRGWGGLFAAPWVAAGALVLVGQGGNPLSLGGLMVGGAIGLWFLMAGLTWLGFLLRLPYPSWPTIRQGGILFLWLWIAFGAMAQFLWLQWWLIPSRLQLWPLLSLASLPWFLAVGIVQQQAGFWQRALGWLSQSAVLVGGFGLVLYLLPQLGFLFLLLPLFPLIMAMLAFVAAWIDDVWSYALGSALFWGWLIVAVFPIAS